MLAAAELRSKERQQALRSLAARSPSTSLSNLAYLLEGYSEAGGGKYTEVLMQISQRVQQILVARNRAVAKAGDALVSARIIPIVLLVVFVFLTRDPLIRDALLAIPVQMVIAAGSG
jgi:Flp pilus assembly protein TadB